jgi:hypothetical protein
VSTSAEVEMRKCLVGCSEIEASLADVNSSSESVEPYEIEDMVVMDEREDAYDCPDDMASSVDGRLDELNSVDKGMVNSRPWKGHSVDKKRIHMVIDDLKLMQLKCF